MQINNFLIIYFLTLPHTYAIVPNSINYLINVVNYIERNCRMKKEELLSDIISTFAGFNRVKAMIDFQFYLKGENFLLSHLQSIGGSSTPGELAQVLDVTAPRIAAILRSLEHKKLIERNGNGLDKRRVTVSITEKGKEWVALANSEVYQHAVNVFDKLGEEDTKELVRIMKKMIKIEDAALEFEKESQSIDSIIDSDSNISK